MKPIFEYEDYRLFLKDFYEESKRSKRYFTYRYFAEKAGLASPMHLQLVMRGKRNLTQKTLVKFAQGLGLKGREADYFENLVYFSQARGSTEKTLYLGRLSRIRTGGRAAKLSTMQQTSLFAKWYYPSIYELVNDPKFVEEGAWLSKRLRRAVTAAEAMKALKELEEGGLLVRDETRRLKQKSYKVRTDDEVENLLVREYHRRMAHLASERIDDALSAREYGFVTVCTTKDRMLKMKQLVKDFIKTANETLTCPPDEMNAALKDAEIVQLNVQLFNVTD